MTTKPNFSLSTKELKRPRKAKLWKVYFQSKRYDNERNEITVNAQNIDQAISKACSSLKDDIASKRNEIEKVELLATED